MKDAKFINIAIGKKVSGILDFKSKWKGKWNDYETRVDTIKVV